MYVNIFVSVYENIFVTIYLNTRHNGFEYIAQHVYVLLHLTISVSQYLAQVREYMYLEEAMWWNHLDFTSHLSHYF